MFAGRFSNQIFELGPKIWYGHSLGYNKKLSWRSPRVFFLFSRVKGKKRYVDISKMPLTHEKKTLGDRRDSFLLYPKECPYQISGSNSKN